MDTKVRDFTGGPSTPAVVQIGLHSAADLLIGLWVLDGCCEESAAGRTDTYDLGSEWFAEFADRLSERTRGLLKNVGSGEAWVGLMSLLPEEGDNGSIDHFIEFLGSYDPAELRFRLLMLHGIVPDDARELAADAAEGNTEALEEVLSLPEFADKPQWTETLRSLLALEPAETRSLFVDALTGAQEDIFSKYEAEFRPALERDVAARRSMARRLSPERLVEITTNGISIEGTGYQRPIMLIPSIVGRPWVVFTESRDHLIMSYPVADEYLEADPDAPPQWLIKTYKALGDERRLRILRRLSRGPASLADLVEEMDASKSTLHHHLMLLRAAGLVKVTLGSDKEYSLRADVVPETAAVLHAYIGAGSREEV